jgi:hypothetical protein
LRRPVSGDRANLVQIEHAPERGFVHDVGDLLDGLDLSEIDDRSRHGGHRDAVSDRDVAGVEAIAPVDGDPLDPDSPRRDHGYRRRPTPSDPPELRRRAMVQRRAFSGGEHRGEHAGLARERGMADRIDAQMDAVKLAARPSPTRRARAHPGGTEVLRPYQPVLPTRDLRQLRVGWCRSVAAGAIV